MPGIHIGKKNGLGRDSSFQHTFYEMRNRDKGIVLGLGDWLFWGTWYNRNNRDLCAQHGRRKEMIPQSCPLTSVCALWYRCTFKTYKWLGTVSWIFLHQ